MACEVAYVTSTRDGVPGVPSVSVASWLAPAIELGRLPLPAGEPAREARLESVRSTSEFIKSSSSFLSVRRGVEVPCLIESISHDQLQIYSLEIPQVV